MGVIGPQIDHVMRGGGATWGENQLIPITRNGRKEDVYWTYSYGPIDDIEAPSGVGGVLVICTETTQTMLSQKAKGEELARQREVFEQSPGFTIVMSGPQHQVDFVNGVHRKLFGSDHWIGKTIREAFPDVENQGFFEILDNVYRTQKPYRSGRIPVKFKNPADGTWRVRTLDFIYAPIKSADGVSSGVFCEGFDLTEEEHAVAGRLQSDERLRVATDAAGTGFWDVDLIQNRVYWPPSVKDMFGVAPDFEVSMKDFYDGLHPEDKEAVIKAFSDAQDPFKRAVYDVEYRAVGKNDGVVRWIAAKGRGMFDAEGRCVRVVGTAMDVTRRRLAEQALLELDHRKNVFLATLAHELRNPLAPIRNAAQILLHPSASPEQIRRSGEMVERQIASMSSLLDDLLEVTRISIGKVELRKSMVNLSGLVNAAMEPAMPLLQAKKLDFVLTMPSQEYSLEVDPLRAAQVLTNILTNAAKYTREGMIELRVRVVGPRARFEVIDTGVGLSSEQIPHLFEMFTQAAHTLDVSQGGLGIGLAVAKGLVDLHGGTIAASSPGVGKGAMFTIEFPGVQPESTSRSQSKNPVVQAGRKLQILVVDDNSDAADSFAELLTLKGHAVQTAYDGFQALGVLQGDGCPDVCFLDIGMPGMDGYELASKVRAIFTSRHPVLVATTGWGQAEDRTRSAEAGFDAHLTKPIDLDAVDKLLSEVPASRS